VAHRYAHFSPKCERVPYRKSSSSVHLNGITGGISPTGAGSGCGWATPKVPQVPKFGSTSRPGTGINQEGLAIPCVGGGSVKLCSGTGDASQRLSKQTEKVNAETKMTPQIHTPKSRDWNALLTRSGAARPTLPGGIAIVPARPVSTPEHTAIAERQKIKEVSPAALARNGSLPAGLHDVNVLARLVEGGGMVSGLVVAIGVCATEEARIAEEANGGPTAVAVRRLIQSLLGEQDFACASGPDEFLLIFPRERGAAAQRRLKAISQKLWDFHLHMLGETLILFSWGGLEVRGETIEEAIASANERMEETRRSRAAKSGEFHRLRTAG